MCGWHNPNVTGILGLGMMCLVMACLYAPIIIDRACMAPAWYIMVKLVASNTTYVLIAPVYNTKVRNIFYFFAYLSYRIIDDKYSLENIISYH